MKVKNSRIKILCITIILMFALQGCGESKGAYKDMLEGKWISYDLAESEEKMYISFYDDIWSINFSGDGHPSYKCEIYPDDEHSGSINIIGYGDVYKVEYNFEGYDILYLSGDIEGEFERMHE